MVEGSKSPSGEAGARKEKLNYKVLVHGRGYLIINCYNSGHRRGVPSRIKEVCGPRGRRVERQDDGQVGLRLQRGVRGRLEVEDSQKNLQENRRTRSV